MKFFLALYGHKLPVLSMDISSDGTLLASGSADKNLKIWGLDFGDCHRSLFAHSDSVMQVWLCSLLMSVVQQRGHNSNHCCNGMKLHQGPSSSQYSCKPCCVRLNPPGP